MPPPLVKVIGPPRVIVRTVLLGSEIRNVFIAVPDGIVKLPPPVNLTFDDAFVPVNVSPPLTVWENAVKGTILPLASLDAQLAFEVVASGVPTGTPVVAQAPMMPVESFTNVVLILLLTLVPTINAAVECGWRVMVPLSVKLPRLSPGAVDVVK